MGSPWKFLTLVSHRQTQLEVWEKPMDFSGNQMLGIVLFVVVIWAVLVLCILGRYKNQW
jgi:hypothetical protein